MSNEITVYEFDMTSRMHPFLDAVQTDTNVELKDNQTTVAPADGSQFFNGKEWVSELVNAYHYDDNGYFDYFTIVPKGSDLQANETLVVPYDKDGRGMYKPKFDTMQNAWIETLTQEEIDALNKPATPKPTDMQLAVAQMGSQLAILTTENLKLKQDNVKLGQTVQALGMQVAQVVAKNGGTN